MAHPKEFVDMLYKMMVERGKVTPEHAKEFLSEKNIAEFRKAFTHPSYSRTENYQIYEFLGDKTIDEFTVFYIHWRFPRIVKEKWLTRIQHNISHEKFLGKMAIDQGLDKYILYGEDIQNIIDKYPGTYKTKRGYMKMAEDVMESFCGCFIMIIENSGQLHGVAVQIVHNILRTFYDSENLPTKYEIVFDGISRLKEMYDLLHWPDKQKYVYKTEPRGVLAIVYGWARGDKKYHSDDEQKNRVELARAIGSDKSEAAKAASEIAIGVLEREYGITEIPSNPYEI